MPNGAGQDTERGASLRVGIAREGDAGRWDAFVAAQPDASSYHAWAWGRVFQRAFGHRPLYLMARRGTAVHGVLPLVQINSLLFGRTLTSLPFVNYGGVIATDEASVRALVNASGDLAFANGCTHVELRHVHRRVPRLPCRQHKVTMRLSLPSAAWDRLDKKVRNQIRKAAKSGLTSVHGGLELLPEFYTVFARNMRDLGTPVYGRRVFEQVLRTFPDRAEVHVVRLGAVAIAAGVTLRTGTTTELPWASSVRDYNALCPNHLLYWSVIERAVESGCEVLDLGRSTPGEGTFLFKAQWGAEPVALHWEYILMSGRDVPDTSPRNPKYQAAITLWKRLPVPVATLIGPRIVRSIP